MEASSSSINIKTEPGSADCGTSEDNSYEETVEWNNSKIKVEPLSADWEPNEAMDTDGAENKTTIKIESVSGSYDYEHSKDKASGYLKTEEIDISDLECGNDSEAENGSSMVDSKPQGFSCIRALQQKLKRRHCDSLDPGSYQCASCLANFPNKRSLGKHVTDVCFRNLSPRSKRELKLRLATEDNVQITSFDRLRRSKSLRCLKCRQVFKSDVDLKLHKVEFHPKLLSHRCEVCGKAFAKNSYKQRHMEIHTLAGRIHKCEQCNIVFTQSLELKSHLKIVHPEVRPYKCELCDKSFFRSCHRSRHINIHTQKINYACEICDSKFTQGSNLKSHMLIHANVRRYVCNVCGKKFRQASDHKKHMLIHSGERPHKCRTCDKPFQTISSRNHHELIHSGVRNFACEVCSRAFVSNCHLKRHMHTHNKEKKRKIVGRKTEKIVGTVHGSESDDWKPLGRGKTFVREKMPRKIVTRGMNKIVAEEDLNFDDEILDGQGPTGIGGDL